MDQTDYKILSELQEEGRVSFRELGRRIKMSPPAVAERVRRLEESGAIRGYKAIVDVGRLGFTLTAFVRVRYPSGDYRPFEKAIRDRPEIVDCYHVTGEDCFLLKVIARSMAELEGTTGVLARLGATTTSLVFSTLLADRTVAPADIARARSEQGSGSAREATRV